MYHTTDVCTASLCTTTLCSLDLILNATGHTHCNGASAGHVVSKRGGGLKQGHRASLAREPEGREGGDRGVGGEVDQHSAVWPNDKTSCHMLWQSQPILARMGTTRLHIAWALMTY